MTDLASQMNDTRIHSQRTGWAGIPYVWWAAYIAVLAVCFLLFQQPDLYHTSASSYAYLNGHFADFYDYNRPRVERNDYLPVIYAIFALWNLPLKALGLMSVISADAPPGSAFMVLTPVEIAWTKLLLVVAFAAAVVSVGKIAKTVAPREAAANPWLAPALFAGSPIAIFAIFIFGQYDIIGMVFALAGFHALLTGRSLRGALLFSVAASFKFFAFVAFLPLVLLLEKRLLRIAELGLAGASATLIQLALYWHSPVFREEIFVLARGKGAPLTNAVSVFAAPMFYLGLLYAVLCIAAFLYRPRGEFERARAAVLVPIAAYGLFFTAVVWHPQWLVIPMPFFALAALFIRRRGLLVAADAVGGVALVWISVNLFRFNVDSSMLTSGPLKHYFPFVYTGVFSLLPDLLTRPFRVILHSYLFLPLVLVAYERRTSGRAETVGLRAIAARLCIATGLFVLPALATAWMPREVAVRLDPRAAVAGLAPGPMLASSTVPAGEILGDHVALQEFVPADNGLRAIGVRLATYARRNTSTFRMRVLDQSGAVIADKSVPASEVGDSVVHYLDVPLQPASSGRSYTLVLSSPDAKPGNALTAWTGPAPEGSEARRFEMSGVTKPGALAMQLFYARERRGTER